MVTTYLLDTSAIIDAVKFYPEQPFARLWNNLSQLIEEEKRGFSIDEVRKEIPKFKIRNNIKDNHPILSIIKIPNFFILPSAEVFNFFKEKLEVVYKESNRNLAGKPFADPLLIAQAGVKGYHVITSETTGNIPTICDNLDIQCGTIANLIEREGWVF